MNPRIQYTTTPDGVRIAYWTMGSGPPLVFLRAEIASHVVNELAMLELRGFYDGLAKDRTLVRYDTRGCGLSTREIDDWSYEALAVDLLAVVDALGYERVDVLAVPQMAPAAVLMAAHRPERLGRLAILGANLPSAIKLNAFRRALDQLREEYPEDCLRIQLHLVVGWENSGLAMRLSKAYLGCTSPAHSMRVREREEAFDYAPLVSLVRAPTLLVGGLELGAHGGPAMIPGVQFANVAKDYSSYLVDWEPHLAEITRFLDEGKAGSAAPAPMLPQGTAIILLTDIVDSTALTERLGDAAFREKARELGSSLRAVIRECAGTPVEGPTLGDGVLAIFTSGREAIEAARRCARAGDDAGLPLHIGLHAGDVSREKDSDGRDNVYGGAVNVASRISGLSAPGEVLVSETVRSLARTSADVTFEDRGEQKMKGVGEAVRLWAVMDPGE